MHGSKGGLEAGEDATARGDGRRWETGGMSATAYGSYRASSRNLRFRFRRLSTRRSICESHHYCLLPIWVAYSHQGSTGGVTFALRHLSGWYNR